MTGRVDGWETRLSEVVERYHVYRPAFDWSSGRNCFYFAMDAVKAVTGKDPYEHMRGARSEEEATELIASHGFKSLEAMIEAEFVEVPVAQAHRGDIGFILHNNALILIVFINAGIVGLTEVGLKFLSRAQVYKAYKVGRR